MTNVIERKSNLVMPVHYAELDSEEMSYVEGGFYISNQQICQVLMACAFNPVGTALVGLGLYKLAAKITALGTKLGAKIGGLIGGWVGRIIGALIGTAALGSIALTVADALIQGKGINVSWKKTFFGMPYWVDISVQ